MIVPILILTKERPLQLIDMIKSIEAATDPSLFRIIICDNNSIDLSVYQTIKHEVIYNKSNMMYKGFNSGLERITEDYFVLSDPDIRLNDSMPKDWPLKMIECLKELNIPKIGLALNINFKEDNNITKRIKQCESCNWQQTYKVNSIPDTCYIAPIDTTFAMYRRDTYEYWAGQKTLSFNKGMDGRRHLSQNLYNKKYSLLHNGNDTTKVIRIADRFTADHLGWDPKYFDELKYYSTVCNLKIASTVQWYKRNKII